MDANVPSRTLLRRRLERLGYAVEEAAGGQEVLDRLAAEPFDIVLLDVRTAGVTGIDFLERRQLERQMRAVPVVVLCSTDDADPAVRAIEAGADDYLSRPFDPVLLRTRIQGLLERRRLAEQAKIASLGVLTARVVDQVRNPLNFVVNFAELADEILDDGPPSPEMLADVKSHLRKVREHADRIDEVLTAMLTHPDDPS